VEVRKFLTLLGFTILTLSKHATILRGMLERWGGVVWYGLDWFGSGQEPVEGFCEHGNEPSGSKKYWEILE
jgi:hypothetical protein